MATHVLNTNENEENNGEMEGKRTKKKPNMHSQTPFPLQIMLEASRKKSIDREIRSMRVRLRVNKRGKIQSFKPKTNKN